MARAKSKTAIKRKPRTVRLPNKPSALITLALKDLAKSEKAGDIINMGTWFEQDEVTIWCGITGDAYVPDHVQEMILKKHHAHIEKRVTVCTVCFAGSVMKNSLKASAADGTIQPEDFNEDTERKLNALDFFRSGYIEGGLRHMNITIPRGLRDVEVTPYGHAPKKWRKDMDRVVAALKKRRL